MTPTRTGGCSCRPNGILPVKEVIASASRSWRVAEAASSRRRSSNASILRFSELLRSSGCGGGTVGVADLIRDLPR